MCPAVAYSARTPIPNIRAAIAVILRQKPTPEAVSGDLPTIAEDDGAVGAVHLNSTTQWIVEVVDEALALEILFDKNLIVTGPKAIQPESISEVYPARFPVDLGAGF